MLEVLYEDNHLLAVNKPALLPTMGVAAGKGGPRKGTGDGSSRPSLLVLAKEYIRRKYDKPGNVYLGVVSRLDAPVTGVVLMARTSKAARRLTEQFRNRSVEKIYWALVEGRVAPPAGQLRHYVRKNERHRRMHVCGPEAHGARLAELTYRVLRPDKETGRQGDKETFRESESPCLPVSLSPSLAPCTLLEVQLHTGRKHQIRLQLSDAGFPILGDRKYGSRREFARGIALHSRRLVVVHPVRKIPVVLEAPLPPSWQGVLQRLC